VQRFRITLITLVLLALLAGPAVAEVGDVVVGGVLVLRIRAEAGGMSVQQRAMIVEQRITNALSKARSTPQTIAVRMVGGQPAIFAGDIMLITVDANHARLNGTTQLSLAGVWARNLREALPKAVPKPLGP